MGACRMFKKIMSAFAASRADKDIEHGLSLVQEKWLAYRSVNQKPPEHEIIQFAGPFIAPMMDQLASDSRWRNKPQSATLDLIFVVLLADAETEIGQTKLRAARELLGEK
jgi:hypothetical protein